MAALPISQPTIAPDDSLALVSIVIPCYNGAQYLATAIESALGQTHSNVEVIVVDDGSTDASAAIVSRYPVRVVHGSRKGVSAARNRGIAESRGKYLIFLDADDILMPDAISSGIAALLQHPAAKMATGAHQQISAAGNSIAIRNKPLQETDLYQALLQTNFIECTSSCVFRRDAQQGSEWFDTKLQAAEDYDVYLRLARSGQMVCHDTIVSSYRLHGANVSHKAELMLTSTLKVMKAQRTNRTLRLRHRLGIEAGMRAWKRQYGRQLTRQLASNYAAGRQPARMGTWLTLARSYPVGAFIALTLQAFPRRLAGRLFTSRKEAMSEAR